MNIIFQQIIGSLIGLVILFLLFKLNLFLYKRYLFQKAKKELLEKYGYLKEKTKEK